MPLLNYQEGSLLLSEVQSPALGPRHFAGCCGSASALIACHVAAREGLGQLVLLVVPSALEAEHAVDDLTAFSPNARVVYLPAPDQSPYDNTRGDRHVDLNRAAALAALDNGQTDFLVTTANGWIRLASPPEALASATMNLLIGESLNMEVAARSLTRGGYQRVPAVQDPGTFAIRGDLLDVWPPGSRDPSRVELAFDKIARIRPYDPDTQITRSPNESLSESALLVAPARECVITEESTARARVLLRALCDAVSFPSKKAKALIDEIASGHLFIGAGGFLPAHAELVPLSSRLPTNSVVIFADASRIVAEVTKLLDQAHTGYLATAHSPRFAPELHYLMGEALDLSVTDRRVICLHDTPISGGESTGFLSLRSAPIGTPSVQTTSQDEFARRLTSTRKQSGRSAGLLPLAHAVTQWLEHGLCVVMTARVQSQADRLASLLLHRGFTPVRTAPNFLSPERASLHIVSSPLGRGLVAPLGGLVLLTEEEIFGTRVHRTARKAKDAILFALDDLRALRPGDLVVHQEHGIGRYSGLSHQIIGGHAVDLFVVEYHGGDRLLLPVYRLSQIQKFAGEGAPQLDRLGGQSFSKTKASVRKKVRQIADQLLQLYAERLAVTRPPLEAPGDEYAAFEAAFPYEETPDQAAAIADVLSDLQRDTVMDRLICGDVGFGKTEVALRAVFLSALAGRQVAVLCPTTILAEQHLRTFRARLSGSGIQVEGLSRFRSKKQQQETLVKVKSGLVDVLIGTHRLLSTDVHFKTLGLVVVDEEQRFGVTDKERLKNLKKTVDVLTLSATPIPRTLNLAIGGLRSMSVIGTPPHERRAIRTITARFDEHIIRDAILAELGRGGQVFYVYNRVEGLYERAELLRRLVPEARIGVGHGQMSEHALEKTMLGFVAGEFDILCATAIVESGLDIPAANTIIIDRADRFGLSQLYQLRGRVGRSAERAYCYLLVPTDSELEPEAKSRISALERYTELGSGFHVATMDMELRGTGELLGADQSGFVARVGFELFSSMLEQATAELRGESYIPEVDPELSIDVEALLPEAFIPDVGARLSLYKKYAQARDEADIQQLNEEVEDRFGRAPEPARRFFEVMRLKTELRRLRALGLSANSRTATLHLREDTPLRGEVLVPFVIGSEGRYALSPDGRLIRRAPANLPEQDGLSHADRMLSDLQALLA